MKEHHGKIWWTELMTSDLEASKKFYSDVTGWSFDGMPMPDGNTYTLFKTDGEVRGGMLARTPGDFEGPDAWMSYFAVSDVDAAVDAVGGRGGSVMRPPFDVPGVGRIAIVADATGAVSGIMTPADQG